MSERQKNSHPSLFFVDYMKISFLLKLLFLHSGFLDCQKTLGYYQTKNCNRWLRSHENERVEEKESLAEQILAV